MLGGVTFAIGGGGAAGGRTALPKGTTRKCGPFGGGGVGVLGAFRGAGYRVRPSPQTGRRFEPPHKAPRKTEPHRLLNAYPTAPPNLPKPSTNHPKPPKPPKTSPKRNFKGYEEVRVPPAPALPPPTAGELVGVPSLPGWCQAAFPGYATLNRIQSRIYPAAFGRWARLILLCYVMFCLVLSCLVLSCLVLSCLVLLAFGEGGKSVWDEALVAARVCSGVGCLRVGRAHRKRKPKQHPKHQKPLKRR